MKVANNVEQTGAFPTSAPEHGSQDGLTKREWFAGQCLEGLLDGAFVTGPPAEAIVKLPKMAVELADRLIEELDK